MIQQPEGLVVTADMSRDMLEALDTLAAERVVEGPPWQLTEVAKERVEQCVLLRNEESLLQRCAGELSEASTYQLILEMDAQGWVHEIVSVREYRDMKRAQAAYRHGELKVWRTCEMHSSVSRYYLLALLLKGPEMPVPHVAKQETYMKMLGISLEDSGQLNRGRKRKQFQHTNEADWPVPAVDVPANRASRPRRAQPEPHGPSVLAEAPPAEIAVPVIEDDHHEDGVEEAGEADASSDSDGLSYGTQRYSPSPCRERGPERGQSSSSSFLEFFFLRLRTRPASACCCS